MYLPEHFAEHDPAELRRLIAAHPLGTLVTLGSDGLNANHIPFMLVDGAGGHGRRCSVMSRGAIESGRTSPLSTRRW